MARSLPAPRALQVLALCALVAMAAPHPAYAVRRASVSASQGDEFVAAARSVDPGGQLTVTGFQLEGQAGAATLELRQVSVWAPTAVIDVRGPKGSVKRHKPPASVHFRGRVADMNGSAVLLAVHPDGTVSGLASGVNQSWALSKPRGDGMVQAAAAGRPGDQREQEPFRCGDGGRAPHPPPLNSTTRGNMATAPLPLAGRGGSSSGRQLKQWVQDRALDVNIAIETDHEYFLKFGNVDAAARYAADLIGYADLIYSREVGVDLVITYLRVWSTPNDPYPSTTDLYTALYNLRDHWNTNMQSVDRTVVHMLSGKGLLGGLAYVGVLCDAYRRGWGNNLAYGVSGSIANDFRWNRQQTSNPTTISWDMKVVAHELGHNFGSDHTHEYCGIGGNPEPIDRCAASPIVNGRQCVQQWATGLPACSSPTPHFPRGPGTLMSYCHTLRGGYANVALTLGAGHTCGNSPGRVVDVMTQHVRQMAAAYPRCFAQRVASSPPPSPAPPPPQQVAPTTQGFTDCRRGWDVLGGDLPGMPLVVGSLHQCLTACLGTAACEIAIYTVWRQCWLKRRQGTNGNTGPSSIVTVSCIKDPWAGSAQGFTDFRWGWDVIGTNLPGMPLWGSSRDQCLAACRANSACEHIIYELDQRCWLKRRLGNHGSTGPLDSVMFSAIKGTSSLPRASFCFRYGPGWPMRTMFYRSDDCTPRNGWGHTDVHVGAGGRVFGFTATVPGAAKFCFRYHASSLEPLRTLFYRSDDCAPRWGWGLNDPTFGSGGEVWFYTSPQPGTVKYCYRYANNPARTLFYRSDDCTPQWGWGTVFSEVGGGGELWAPV